MKSSLKMNFRRASIEIRHLFRTANRFILEEVMIHKELITFLKQDEINNHHQILFEENILEMLKQKLLKYWRFSEVLLVGEQFEHCNIGELQLNHIWFPRDEVTNKDIILIKNLSKYCTEHDSTICGCNNLLPR